MLGRHQQEEIIYKKDEQKKNLQGDDQAQKPCCLDPVVPGTDDAPEE